MLSPKLLEVLREHWRGLRQQAKRMAVSRQPLAYRDTPITTKVVWDACKKAAQQAGLQKDVHPHTLRHYAEFRTMPHKLGLSARTTPKISVPVI